MKIKTPTEFLTFCNGHCDLYSVKNNQLDEKIMTLPFGERTVTMKRFYTAKAATVKIDRLIHVPLHPCVTAECNAVIDGIRYKIEQAQPVTNTNPPAVILTLRKIGGLYDKAMYSG